MKRLGTPSSLADQNVQNRVCHSGNVDPRQYVKVQLPRLGDCWAYVVKTSEEEKQQTGERYAVSILGWGMDAAPFWDDLSEETKVALLTHARQNGLLPELKLIPFKEVGRVGQSSAFVVDGLPGWSIEKINSRWEARKVKNQVAVFSQKFNTKKEAFQFLQGVENVN
jgi:hypothetical protein